MLTSTQLRLMRGSIAACAISTIRFRNTKNSASTRIVPCSSGRSRWKIAELSTRPEPGPANNVSTRIQPASKKHHHDQNRAAEHVTQLKSHHRERGRRRVLDDVPEHIGLTQALGAQRFDKI